MILLAIFRQAPPAMICLRGRVSQPVAMLVRIAIVPENAASLRSDAAPGTENRLNTSCMLNIGRREMLVSTCSDVPRIAMFGEYRVALSLALTELVVQSSPCSHNNGTEGFSM